LGTGTAGALAKRKPLALCFLFEAATGVDATLLPPSSEADIADELHSIEAWTAASENRRVVLARVVLRLTGRPDLTPRRSPSR
jgi:hypothetical protein